MSTPRRQRKSARLDPDRLSATLGAWIADHQLTQREAAERLGVTQTDVSRWLHKRGLPSPSMAARVLPLLGVTGDELAPPTPGHTPAVLAAADVVLIPRDGTAGAGDFGVGHDGDEAHDADAYPASELQRSTGLDPAYFRSTVVVGDSMMPMLRAGDRVIYLPTTEISDHGLYVLDLDGARVVKLVQRRGGGILTLIPRNKTYERESFSPVPDASEANTYRSDFSGATTSIRVVGKVLWFPTLA